MLKGLLDQSDVRGLRVGEFGFGIEALVFRGSGF